MSQPAPDLRRWLNGLLTFYSLVPAALLVAFFSFVVRARLALGRWPTPMEPDPKSLPFETHFDTVYGLFLLSGCCLVPWLTLAWFRLRLAPWPRLASRILLPLPWLLAAVVSTLDPGDFVAWFLD